MSKKLSDQFPTFKSVALGLKSIFHSSTNLSTFVGLRGPTWRISTWWPTSGRATNEKSLLRLLAVAHQEQLDTTRVVSQYAREFPWIYRRRLTRLVSRLKSGTPLINALEQTPELLSDQTVLALRFASQSGTLSQAYPQLIQSLESAPTGSRRQLAYVFSYVTVIMLVFGLIVPFLFLFILPTFDKIADEFRVSTTLPWAASTLASASNLLSHGALVWLILYLGLLIAIFSLPTRRVLRRFIASRFLGPVAAQRTSELLTMLAGTVESGRPISGALSTLARYHFDKRTRQKLLFARNEVEQGGDPWVSLADVNLLSSSESKGLSKLSSNRTRAWAMRRLAENKIRNIDRYWSTAYALIHSLCILAFAGIVLWLSTGFFGYLITLIGSVPQ